jgi:uncharacterized membrane protein
MGNDKKDANKKNNTKTGKPTSKNMNQKNQAKPKPKLPPEEQIKHIPKTVVEERFMHGHTPHPKRTMGQKASDFTTRWVGSWTFIVLLFIFMAIWIAINIYLIFSLRWDPYPFILLNFVLSCLAAIQAPIILMSQNRQTERDRMKAERDFAINRKAEKEIEDIQHDLEIIKGMLRKSKH